MVDVVDVVDVATAAAALGISAGAIRKRLERGHLAGHKHGGQWRVRLSSLDRASATRRDATGHDTTGATGHDAPEATGSTAVSSAARSQLEAIRDEWLRPLMERNEGLARQLGRVEQERDQLRAEVGRLRLEQDAAGRPQDGPGEAAPQRTRHPAPRPWWRWWER